jgi:hypothetical protein
MLLPTYHYLEKREGGREGVTRDGGNLGSFG